MHYESYFDHPIESSQCGLHIIPLGNRQWIVLDRLLAVLSKDKNILSPFVQKASDTHSYIAPHRVSQIYPTSIKAPVDGKMLVAVQFEEHNERRSYLSR